MTQQIRSLPIGWDHTKGKLVLGLNTKTRLEFEPSEEGLVRLVRHLQGLQPIPGSSFKPESFPLPQVQDSDVRTIYTFPTAATGAGSSKALRQVSREQLLDIMDELLEDPKP